ncbi:unnamed protein product [Meloidogyne enterolobii]|uniref:Uncharacterized protein n=1 Tax=Meloidogyne enterolobii TaxID=390850 RepID=A0ACB0ZE30_MELEN
MKLKKGKEEFSQINWKSKKLSEQVNSSLNQSILLLANIKIIQIPQTIKINKINILFNELNNYFNYSSFDEFKLNILIKENSQLINKSNEEINLINKLIEGGGNNSFEKINVYLNKSQNYFNLAVNAFNQTKNIWNVLNGLKEFLILN